MKVLSIAYTWSRRRLNILHCCRQHTTSTAKDDTFTQEEQHDCDEKNDGDQDVQKDQDRAIADGENIPLQENESDIHDQLLAAITSLKYCKERGDDLFHIG